MPPDFLMQQMEWREALDDAARRRRMSTRWTALDSELAGTRREAQLAQIGRRARRRSNFDKAAPGSAPAEVPRQLATKWLPLIDRLTD